MTTPNLQLPEVPEAIQEASDEINAGFLRLDAIVQLAVLDKDLTVAGLPVDAVQGDRYIIASGDRARHVAMRWPDGWLYVVPRPGWRAYVLDEATTYLYTGTDWEEDAGGGTGVFSRSVTWTRASGAIATPVNDGMLRIPVDATIVRATVMSIGGPGSCSIDIRKVAFAAYPPAAPNSICGATKPGIAAGTKYEDAALSDWTPAVAAGDVLGAHLESSSTFTTIFLQLDFSAT